MTEEQLVRRSIEHLHGPEEVLYGKDELVVVCLVRNGRPYIKSFVEHYFSLGAKYIAFLDNNSTDGTVEALKEYENVTVFRTELPYKEHKNLFKRHLIDRFGKRDRWCLCADIDELFDYPYSDIIGLDSLLGYFNSKSYTAVAAQMLDMFPEEPLTGRVSNQDEPLKKRHKFYDISNLKRRSMKERAELHNNILGSENVEYFRGGIREIVFDFMPFLTKHPLVLLDGKTKPMDGSSHWVSNARIADITCALFHYKFVDEYFYGQVDRAVREENYFRNSAEYRKYKEALDKSPSLRVKLETAEEIGDVNDLLENRFLIVSDDYVSWVNAEDKKSVLQGPGSMQLELVEVFLESRRQERSKTLKIQRLEQQLHEQQRLRQHLEQQLESIRASRIWKLIKNVDYIKNFGNHRPS